MLLALISTEPYVQLGFLVVIMVIAIAAMAKARGNKQQELDIADRPEARAHEVDMWRIKQGVIEHKT